MANTSIRIKRSTTTGSPGSLAAGELAYSYLSNTIFVGSPAGTGVINIGGQYYTSQVDSATDAATGGTLVRRDATGNATFNNVTATTINGTVVGSLTGNANSATQFQTDRYINVSGGDISASAQLFNGTANATLSASLTAVSGLTAGTYGGTTTVPIVTVAANGRIMSIANSAAISTSLGIAGDTGTDSVNLATDTLTFTGGSGVKTSVTDNAVTVAVDNATVMRTNTAFTIQKVDGNVEISGNLTVLGSQTTVNVETLNIADPLIFLASNNYVSDVVDIGFVGSYNDGSTKNTGVFRNAGTKEYYIFDSYTGSTSNNVIDVGNASFRTANVNAGVVKANLIGGYVTTGSITTGGSDLLIGPSGKQTTIVNATGVIQPYAAIVGGSYSGNQIDVASVGFGTQIKGLYEGVDIRVSSDGSGTNVSSFNVNGTVTLFGKVTAAGVNLNDFTQAAFNRANSSVSATSTLTSGAIIIGDGSNNVTTLANTTYTQTGTLTAANTVSAITVDAYGRVTALTSSAIAIDANQVTSGTLTVTRGGTGASSFTSGALLVGNGSGAVSELANSTYTATGSAGAAKTVTSLTVDAYGRVTAATFADIAGLTVTQGGTGASTFTTKGIVYGDGSNALQVTAAAGTADQTWSNQILTTTNAGVPVWSSSLDGGQF